MMQGDVDAAGGTAGIGRIGLIDWLRSRVSSAARTRLGTSLLAQGRDAEGFRQLAAAARRGVAEAQYRVGCCYLAARGVPQSPAQAAHWLELAARQDHRAAQTQLAMLLFEGFDFGESTLFASPEHHRDAGKALVWARRAAEAGEAEAQAVVGHILSAGPEAVRNLDEAERWYRRSAESGCPQGSLGYGLARLRNAAEEVERMEAARHIVAAAKAGLPTAIHLTATLLADGHGVPRNPALSAKLFERAAGMGIVAAQTRWGVALMEGAGTQRNVALAESWLRRAALSQDGEAATRLGALYTQGGEVAPNFTEAAHWLELGATQGQPDAARMLAQLYLTGAGVQRDPERASAWLEKAMLAGDEQASTDLGNLVLNGEAGRFDASLLSQRFKAAAEAGDPFAAFNYGVCLARGIGVTPDWRSSIVWLSKSKDAVPEATFWIEDIETQHSRDDQSAIEAQTPIAEEAKHDHGFTSLKPSQSRSLH